MMKKMAQLFAGIVSVIFLLAFTAAADVTVYAEGAYTNADLVVYVYADIKTYPVISYGIKLTYDPLQVNNPSVVKNDSVWYFGTQAAPLETPNANPDTTVSGEVVVVGGKLDQAAPTAGVMADRTLIAVVTFDRLDTAVVPAISLGLGKGGDYANFVQINDGSATGSTELDDTADLTFSPSRIFQRGDANADGYLTSGDMFAVRSALSGPYKVWVDCNGDGYLTSGDMFCVKSKL